MTEKKMSDFDEFDNEFETHTNNDELFTSSKEVTPKYQKDESPFGLFKSEINEHFKDPKNPFQSRTKYLSRSLGKLLEITFMYKNKRFSNYIPMKELSSANPNGILIRHKLIKINKEKFQQEKLINPKLDIGNYISFMFSRFRVIYSAYLFLNENSKSLIYPDDKEGAFLNRCLKDDKIIELIKKYDEDNINALID